MHKRNKKNQEIYELNRDGSKKKKCDDSNITHKNIAFIDSEVNPTKKHKRKASYLNTGIGDNTQLYNDFSINEKSTTFVPEINSVKKHKKKHKEKETYLNIDTYNNTQLCDDFNVSEKSNAFIISEVDPSKKHKKKHKEKENCYANIDTGDNIQLYDDLNANERNTAFTDSEMDPPKKHKKKHKENETSYANTDTGDNIQLYDDLNANERNTAFTDSEMDPPKKHKKKHKEKTSCVNTYTGDNVQLYGDLNISEGNTVFAVSETDPPKKHKKKRKEKETCYLNTDTCDNIQLYDDLNVSKKSNAFTVSEMDLPKKHKKKHKEKETYVNTDTCDNIQLYDDLNANARNTAFTGSEMDLSKEHKKKHKEKETYYLNTYTGDNVQLYGDLNVSERNTVFAVSETDPPKKHKKKHKEKETCYLNTDTCDNIQLYDDLNVSERNTVLAVSEMIPPKKHKKKHKEKEICYLNTDIGDNIQLYDDLNASEKSAAFIDVMCSEKHKKNHKKGGKDSDLNTDVQNNTQLYNDSNTIKNSADVNDIEINPKNLKKKHKRIEEVCDMNRDLNVNMQCNGSNIIEKNTTFDDSKMNPTKRYNKKRKLFNIDTYISTQIYNNSNATTKSAVFELSPSKRRKKKQERESNFELNNFHVDDNEQLHSDLHVAEKNFPSDSEIRFFNKHKKHKKNKEIHDLNKKARDNEQEYNDSYNTEERYCINAENSYISKQKKHKNKKEYDLSTAEDTCAIGSDKMSVEVFSEECLPHNNSLVIELTHVNKKNKENKVCSNIDIAKIKDFENVGVNSTHEHRKGKMYHVQSGDNYTDSEIISVENFPEEFPTHPSSHDISAINLTHGHKKNKACNDSNIIEENGFTNSDGNSSNKDKNREQCYNLEENECCIGDTSKVISKKKQKKKHKIVEEQLNLCDSDLQNLNEIEISEGEVNCNLNVNETLVCSDNYENVTSHRKRKRHKESFEDISHSEFPMDFVEDPVDFEIPDLHAKESVKNLTKEEREQLQNQGIFIKMGKFTKEEDKIIEKNFENFSKQFGVSDPFLLLGIGRSQGITRGQKLQKYIKAKHFYLRLGKGLNNRMLHSIYKRARVILHPYKNEGKFDDMEVSRLKRLHTAVNNKWEYIGDALGRSGGNCYEAYRWHKKPISKGTWSIEESEQLIKAIQKVSGSSDLSWDKIKSINWEQVAQYVPARNSSQCRIYCANHLGWHSDSKREKWNNNCYSKLVKILSKLDVENASDINWTKVHKSFVDVAPSDYFLQKRWHHLKSLIPGYKDMKYKKIIKILCKKYNIHE